MKNRKQDGAASVASNITPLNPHGMDIDAIPELWLRRMEARCLELKGTKKSDLEPALQVEVDSDVADLIRALARRVAKRCKARIWQAEAAIAETAIRLALSGDAE